MLPALRTSSWINFLDGNLISLNLLRNWRLGTIVQELLILIEICFQISCVQNTHCDFQYGVDPIPVSDDSVEFSLHLNLLGEPQTMSGPMEIGESIAVQCKDFGNLHKMSIRIKLMNWYFIRIHI